MRFEGPIARQNQFLFASDWMTYVDEDLGALLSAPLPAGTPGGVHAQVHRNGPDRAFLGHAGGLRDPAVRRPTQGRHQR